MIVLMLSGLLIAGGGGAQLEEMENCDAADLNVCVELIPRTPVGLPRNKNELDAHCQAYQTGMVCMDAWIKRCLPTDGQKLLQQQIGGARALMRFLCTNDTALRREFLKEPTCWGRVSPDWSRCVDELQIAVRENTERAQQLTYFNRNAELCCSRDDFIQCVTHAGRSCSIQASTLLRRMAWVLAHDIAACNQQPRHTARRHPSPIQPPFSQPSTDYYFIPHVCKITI
ncbi:unnamed protein product [Spodoptera littoralis]|uniref:Secreted protein n=1 Tax=Spodoptera littoralis TaxID=7109 RepID=A0A9P0HZS8_SPOLI|nr:unnamed protein product [Spodoptera littoralis]CAH1636469.1 unnamed protein product [Spodoptera littoralis]